MPRRRAGAGCVDWSSLHFGYARFQLCPVLAADFPSRMQAAVFGIYGRTAASAN